MAGWGFLLPYTNAPPPITAPRRGKDRKMSLDYVNEYYGKSFAKGMRVNALGKSGVITRGTNYVFVKLDGEKSARPYHPDDVEDTHAE